MFKYTIVTPNEEDPNFSVIKKEGITAEFTMSDINRDRDAAKKLYEQIKAQKDLDEAKIKNVTNYHPYVLEATEQEKERAVAISLYNGLENKIKEHNDRLAEIEELFKEHDAEIEEIKKQTGESFEAKTPDPVEAPKQEGPEEGAIPSPFIKNPNE